MIVKRPPAQPADDATGTFNNIELGDKVELVGDKEEWAADYRFPTDANIVCNDKEQPTIENRDGSLFLVGRLEVPQEPGFIAIRIDPPDQYAVLGIEEPVVINPSSHSIPTASRWGLILTALLLGLAGVVFIAGLKRCKI